FHSFVGAFFAIWVAIFSFAIGGQGRRPSRRGPLVGVAFPPFGLLGAGNLPPVPLAGPPLAAPARAGHRERPPPGSPINWAVLGFLVVIGFRALSQAAAVKDYNLDTYPVESMRFVEQQGLLGSRMLTTDEWSAYVIHEYWPRQRVFMDDRY